MSKEKSVRIKSAILPEDYAAWVASLKKRIFGARQKALLAANTEQIKLYHDIGREILDRQNRQGWGAKVIDRLSADLREAFPDMKGLSASNLKYMRFFAQECPDCAIGHRCQASLTSLSNSGSLPKSVKYILKEEFSMPRNNTLARIFRIRKLSENIGSGFHKMFTGWTSYYKRKPVVEVDFDYYKST